MKFRTEIEIRPAEAPLGYRDRLLAIGSCFAETMAARLAAAKFRITANPTGILFNPLSIADALERLLHPAEIGAEELQQGADGWFHFGFHGSFSDRDAERARARMNGAVRQGAAALAEAQAVIVTFGTAWVFEREGRVVANCHRRPAAEFVRRRLSAEEIAGRCAPLFGEALRDKQIILTVSPVRHLADGLSGNALSKATLRVAAAALEERCPNLHYFPAFEIVTDDLRDYRFYADDLVHPAPQAVAYVWEKFAAAWLDAEARKRLPEVEEIVAAARHRPRDPGSPAHRAFCRAMLARTAALPEIDFTEENACFERCIEINS